jgi:homocysteine S-methyltransferase
MEPTDGEVILLDGSMGHELKERLGQKWSESFQEAMFANSRHPELVIDIHTEYVKCGCDVLTTNSFTLTPSTLGQAGLTRAELPSLLHAACQCAQTAALGAPSSQNVRVAGCLPPLQHCYLKELVGSEAEMREVYEVLCKELAPRVDLFLAETLCCTAEARASTQAAAAHAKPVWLSYTLHDDLEGPPRLRGGEKVADAIADLKRIGAPPTVLLYNCCAPQGVEAALRATRPLLADASSTAGSAVRRLGGYANGFLSTTSEWLHDCGAADMGCPAAPHKFACPTCASEYDPHTGCIAPAAYAEHARGWVEAGASVVGGCCGVGPAHLKAVSESLIVEGKRKP